MTIVDDTYYEPSLVAPLFNDCIDTIAAGYVVHQDDSVALDFVVDGIKSGGCNSHLEGERLRGAVEFHLRNNYSHLPEPEPDE